jgi:hypothetical protein
LADPAFEGFVQKLCLHGLLRPDQNGAHLLLTDTGRVALSAVLRAEKSAMNKPPG